MIRKLAFFVLLVVTSSNANASSFSLVCDGSGAAQVSSTTSVYAQDNAGKSVTGNARSLGLAPFQGQIKLRIDGSQGFIQVPYAMIPGINWGGNGGVWKLDKVKISENSVSGKFTFNIFNHPEFIIDRSTGEIRLQGYQIDYAGVCGAYTPPKSKKF